MTLARLADPAMARFLIVLGLGILVVGLLWPYLSRIGVGRLPGDIVIERDNVTLYFPLMTCFLLSLLFSLVLWVVIPATDQAMPRPCHPSASGILS
jgi:hypothetical protein